MEVNLYFTIWPQVFFYFSLNSGDEKETDGTENVIMESALRVPLCICMFLKIGNCSLMEIFQSVLVKAKNAKFLCRT